MLIRLRIPFYCALFAIGWLAAAQAQGPALTKPLEWRQAQPFCELKFKLELEKSRALSLEFTGSGISSWTDDKGTDLGRKLEGKPPDYTQAWYSSALIVDDGRGVEITLASKKQPAADAGSMTVEGLLHLWQGSKKEAAQVPDVKLEAGQKFEMGGFPFTLKEVIRKEGVLRVVLEAVTPKHLPGDFLEQLVFIDSTGKAIGTRQSGYSSYSVGDPGLFKNKTHRFSYQLESDVSIATLKYSIWADLQESQIPFKVTVPKAK